MKEVKSSMVLNRPRKKIFIQDYFKNETAKKSFKSVFKEHSNSDAGMQ